jgi:hypothetical protein
MDYVTCVGSRDITILEAKIARYIGETLARNNYGMRSGLADGSDIHFYRGFISEIGTEVNNRFQMFMPRFYFKSFRHDGVSFYSITEMDIYLESIEIASTIHPRWTACQEWVKLLHARNIPQVLGPDLKSPSVYLITPNKEISPGRCKGGTNTAFNLAFKRNIPILSYHGLTTKDEIDNLLSPLIQKNKILTNH